jgi:hypothetical protein
VRRGEGGQRFRFPVWLLGGSPTRRGNRQGGGGELFSGDLLRSASGGGRPIAGRQLFPLWFPNQCHFRYRFKFLSSMHL